MLSDDAPKVIEYELKPNSSDWGWSDYYGANFVASNYCNLKEQTNNFFWHHGLVSPWESLSCDHIIFNMKNKKLRYFVSSKFQYEKLKINGFTRVKAIGLPIIYVKKPLVNRINNSLLIMPSHTLVGQIIKNKQAISNFIKLIKKYKNSFTQVGVCLHKNDFENNYWVEEFKSIDIEIFLGAQNNDKNTYYRQAYYYSKFETILTNDFGSHVAYALFYGCKVSISNLSLEVNLMDDGSWARNPDSINHMFSEEFNNLKQSYLQKFYVKPDLAIQDIELGREFVGYYNKISSFRMKFLFGWSFLGKLYWKLNDLKYNFNAKQKLKNLFSFNVI